MATDSKQLLLSQWQTLHNSHESYEHYALIIKLFSVAITVACFMYKISPLIIFIILALLCLQEGIWKTFQSRAANAILNIEQKIATVDSQQDNNAMSLHLFYTDWQESRTSTVALICEYIKNTLKPTVLYPYLPLMLVILVF